MARLTNTLKIALQAELIDLQAVLLDPTQAILNSTLTGSLASKRATIVRQANKRAEEIREQIK